MKPVRLIEDSGRVGYRQGGQFIPLPNSEEVIIPWIVGVNVARVSGSDLVVQGITIDFENQPALI